MPATKSTQTSICSRRSVEAIYYDPALYRNSTAKPSTSVSALLQMSVTDWVLIGVALFLLTIGLGSYLYLNRHWPFHRIRTAADEEESMQGGATHTTVTPLLSCSNGNSQVLLLYETDNKVLRERAALLSQQLLATGIGKVCTHAFLHKSVCNENLTLI
jgi:hypothetical protein